jgi:hypothetical protein
LALTPIETPSELVLLVVSDQSIRCWPVWLAQLNAVLPTW